MGLGLGLAQGAGAHIAINKSDKPALIKPDRATLTKPIVAGAAGIWASGDQ
jgi:hypothetical protein